MTTAATTRWWWLRHAPVPDSEARISGQLDLPCDTSDQTWFAALAQRLPRNPVLVDSGMIRCRQTVGGLEAAGMALPPALVEPALAEQNFGRWQGRSWNVLAAARDPDLPAFWQAPATALPPGGESFAAVVVRVAAVIERLTRDHTGRDILAVAHAGTIRAALSVALDITPAAALAFTIEPLSLTLLDATAAAWRVQGVNWLPG